MNRQLIGLRLRVVLPALRRSQATVKRVRELLESAKFRPVIDQRYSLDQIIEAHRYVETGRKVGGIVIRVEPSS